MKTVLENGLLVKNICFMVLMVLLTVFLAGCVHEPVEGRLTAEQIAVRAEKSARIHTELAAEYFSRGQYKIALEEIDEALQANANYAPAYSMLGLVHMALGENDKARLDFELALRIEPDNSEVHNNYGWFLCERFPEQMEKAVNHFLIALRDPLYETPHVAYANAGICELKRGDYDKANLYLHESISRQPAYRPALVGLIEMDFRAGENAMARKKLAAFLNKYQPTARSLWLGIKIEQIDGNTPAADSYLFQLQKRFPNSNEIRSIKEGDI